MAEFTQLDRIEEKVDRIAEIKTRVEKLEQKVRQHDRLMILTTWIAGITAFVLPAKLVV